MKRRPDSITAVRHDCNVFTVLLIAMSLPYACYIKTRSLSEAKWPYSGTRFAA